MPAPVALAGVHRALAHLDPDQPPAAIELCGGSLVRARNLVALPGSFNPPHVAHTALLRRGVEAVGADAGAFVLSVRTVDKEQISGMLLEDRTWLLCRELTSVPRDVDKTYALVATNRGLYLDQAEALGRLCPDLESLTFVVGYDKIVQIFDPRYYDDREAALAELFARSRFLVAPRDEHTKEDIARLLAAPENERFAPQVQTLDLPDALAHVSSTLVRGGAIDELARLVSPPVARFIAESGCYAQGEAHDAYLERARAMAALG